VSGEESTTEPDDEAVVRTAVEAAEGVIFAAYRRAAIRDVDVTVHFADAQLAVDVYLDVPDDPAVDQVADEAAMAARRAVDDLLGE